MEIEDNIAKNVKILFVCVLNVVTRILYDCA